MRKVAVVIIIGVMVLVGMAALMLASAASDESDTRKVKTELYSGEN